MASAEHHHQKRNSSMLSNLSVGPTNDEELDANDLEVAMINESFEEQMKHSLLFTNPNLKSVFYGASETATTKPSSKKQSPDLGIDEEVFDFKMDISPPPLQFLPNISPPPADKEELDRGQQLNRELERMMLEADEPLALTDDTSLMFDTKYGADPVDYFLSTKHPQGFTFYDYDSILPDVTNIFASFDSHLDLDEQNDDASECADAAEQIAYDVVSSLFADEHKNADSFSDEDEGSMVVNASILRVLQDDEIESVVDEFDSEDDPKLGKSGIAECGDFVEKGHYNNLSLPSRNDSMQTISTASPVNTSDEQTVPVVDSWEQLGDSPIAAEKVYSEAKAVLKKIRAERKATQL